MHSVLITFVSDVPVDQLSAPFSAFADGLQGVDGFVSKAWLQDGSTVGGFYVFRDEASADAYLGSPMVAELQANESFSDFAVRRFTVLDDLSARTGVAATTGAA
jgi:hypothetical protein